MSCVHTFIICKKDVKYNPNHKIIMVFTVPDHTFIPICFRSDCLSFAFEKTSDKRSSAQIGNFSRVSTVAPPWEFANPQQTPMDENQKFLQDAARRFFGFSIFDSMSTKPFCVVWVPFCGQEYWGIQRGKSPWRGVSNRGEEHPVGTYFAGKV